MSRFDLGIGRRGSAGVIMGAGPQPSTESVTRASSIFSKLAARDASVVPALLRTILLKQMELALAVPRIRRLLNSSRGKTTIEGALRYRLNAYESAFRFIATSLSAIRDRMWDQTRTSLNPKFNRWIPVEAHPSVMILITNCVLTLASLTSKADSGESGLVAGRDYPLLRPTQVPEAQAFAAIKRIVQAAKQDGFHTAQVGGNAEFESEFYLVQSIWPLLISECLLTHMSVDASKLYLDYHGKGQSTAASDYLQAMNALQEFIELAKKQIYPHPEDSDNLAPVHTQANRMSNKLYSQLQKTVSVVTTYAAFDWNAMSADGSRLLQDMIGKVDRDQLLKQSKNTEYRQGFDAVAKMASPKRALP